MSAVAPFSVHREVEAAAARLSGHLVATPLVASPWLTHRRNAEVRLKLENVQVTGSFKARGAWNRLSQLSPTERRRGVVAASSGNHGLGVAYAARRLGIEATVFVPSTTPADKQQAIAFAGAALQVHGDDCVVTEQHARLIAAATERVYVSPYNDRAVIAGQGTVAVELLQQWPEVEVVYVAAGGGGLLSGMAGYARGSGARVEWVGCSPEASPALAECVRQGAVVDVPCGPTWSDSTHGGVEVGAITVPLCRDLVDRWIAVSEPEIVTALRGCLAHQHLLAEGAAGVAIAALLADEALRGRRACVVVCGGNLPWERLRELVDGG